MAECFDLAGKTNDQLTRFVSGCCRAEVGSNGTGQLLEFQALELDARDAAEVADVLRALQKEADIVKIPDGDGIYEPMVYTLQHPIKIPRPSPDPAEEITQIEFNAHTLGEISEFLDAVGAQHEFLTFMRCFAKLLGTRLPMNDAILNAMDFVDYLVIRNKIMGKLMARRGRWKRVSILQP